jgi:hypothetical protein
VRAVSVSILCAVIIGSLLLACVVFEAVRRENQSTGCETAALIESDDLESAYSTLMAFDGPDAGLQTTMDLLLSHLPSWTDEGNQAYASFGNCVASAGDVNGDGYDDVVIGAPGYENGETYEGRAYLYLGSSSGLSATPLWTDEGNQAYASFGNCVASAGDVNGDGYADAIVGAPGYENGETYEGRAFLYLGSSSGLSATPTWTAEGDQTEARFGGSVSSAGDVNNDGYDDVVVGAQRYDNGEEDEGRAFLYLGSSSGLSATPSWTDEGDQAYASFGNCVASAGDVNGDGYDDVVVGAQCYENGETYEGRAYLYLGSSSGLSATPTWTAEGDQAEACFGGSVSFAGDVNNDGYDDVIVGAYNYDNGETCEGRAFLYLGSSSGLSATPTWTAEGDQAYAYFGSPVASAGDVNGDGYDDVVVGALAYGETGEGRVYLYLGSASGLSATPTWTAEGDQAEAYFGGSVSFAGDVNGDGYDDVIIGAPGYDNGESNEGRAYLYLGTASGLSVTPSWTAESDQASAWFGSSVASAGDVNGDGFDDVVVGARNYDNGEENEGRAYLYLGSVSGPSATPSWTAEGDQASAWFGSSVASAGDVNGDGFDDIVVGARFYDNGEENEGRAYLYLGSASGLSATPSWTAESDQASAYFGISVASAGDVNNDGFDDVVVGAECYNNGETAEGRAYLYLGSASGLSATPSWTAEGDQASAYFGISVASAGDVNNDGFDEVIVGAYWHDNGEENEGRAYLYLGSASGLSATPSWTAEGDQAGARFGSSVASAGDVNGDGYDDVVVGAYIYDNGEENEGRAYLYLGSASGLSATPSWTAEGDQTDAYFGWSTASAGDVNGDSFDDVIVGAHLFDNGETDEGRVHLYLGSASGLSATPSWTAESDLAWTLFGCSSASAGDVNGDGFDDVVVGAPQYTDGETDEGRAYLYMGYGMYLVTFDQTGLSSDTTGTVLTIGGEPKSYEQLPFSIWVESDSTVVYSYEVTVSSTTAGRRYSLVDISGPSSPITVVTSETSVVGNYDCSPTADAGPDQAVGEGTLFTFDGSDSFDDIGIVNYTWTFTDGTEKTLYEVSPTYTFETPGTYVVTLNVSDTAGNYATDTVSIIVLVNSPPSASFTVSPLNGPVDMTFSVDASSSTDFEDDAGLLEVRWDWEDDGTWDTDWTTEKTATHQYSVPGDYTIRLEVVDTRLLSGQATAQVEVVDDGKPSTSAQLSGTIGENGWYVCEVEIVLEADDEWSDIDCTQFRIDESDWQSYSAPFEISDDGIHTLEYFSEDGAGNIEDIQSAQVKIDCTAPLLDITTENGTVFDTDVVNITLTCSDPCSGVDCVEYCLDGGAYKVCDSETCIQLSDLSDGTHQLSVRILDQAGNEAVQELTFEASIAADDGGGDEGEGEGKSFIESYGLALGIVIAVVIIASALILVLRRRKGD